MKNDEIEICCTSTRVNHGTFFFACDGIFSRKMQKTRVAKSQRGAHRAPSALRKRNEGHIGWTQNTLKRHPRLYCHGVGSVNCCQFLLVIEDPTHSCYVTPPAHRRSQVFQTEGGGEESSVTVVIMHVAVQFGYSHLLQRKSYQPTLFFLREK